tara:strand:+ start:1432 stop:1887 length:456 start_codon:yes stop_codon:yes gene_type:complete
MWTFTDDGFFSTVKDLDNDGHLLVRGRDVESLGRFCARVGVSFKEIQDTPERDYPVRVSVPQQDWVNYVSNRAELIDYSDFKTHCKKQIFNGHYSGLKRRSIQAMGLVWSVMYDEWASRPTTPMQGGAGLALHEDQVIQEVLGGYQRYETT